jgi:glycine oxidase
VIAHRADSGLLKQFYGNLSRKEAQVAQEIVWCNSRQVAELEPSLGERFDGAYFARAEGQVDNRQLLTALAAGLCESNCEWLTDLEVLSVGQNEVHTSTEKHDFDFVIDCRGLGAKKQFANLRGVRGEIIAVHSSEVVLHRPVRVLHPRYSIYVVPRQNYNFIIGATSLESEDYSNISVLSAFSLEPAFANANVVETRVNCRPALSNNLPSIRVRRGLIEANGLHRHGFLVTPSIVSLIVGLIEGVPHDSRFERLFDFRDEVEDSASKNFASENVVLQNLAAKTLRSNRSAPETLEFVCS